LLWKRLQNLLLRLQNEWIWISDLFEVKIKCTLVQAPKLCTGRTAHRGSRGIALLFVDYSTTPGKDPVPIVQEDGWAPGLVWTGAENIAPTRIQSPDRPAHSQSLYWLSYPAHQICLK
jgi:hypothetical protein